MNALSALCSCLSIGDKVNIAVWEDDGSEEEDKRNGLNAGYSGES